MVMPFTILVLAAMVPSGDPAVARLDAETARHRLAAAVASEPSGEQFEALVEIAERADSASLRAVAAYNAGTIGLRLGHERASEMLEAADLQSADPALRVAARMNLGHAALPDSDEPKDLGAIDAAITGYREAARRFRSVLEIDPGHAEAARATEVARRKVRELQALRDQMQAQQDAAQELAEQLQQLADQQQEQAEQSRANADRGQTPGQDAAEAQQGLSEQTQQASDQAGQNPAAQEAQEALERAQQAQQRAEEALERGDAAGAAEEQQRAAEALREAADRMQSQGQSSGEQGQPQPSQGSPEQAPEPSEGSSEGEGATPPQIDPLAEALLDKERREREMRAQYRPRGQRQQVERDW